MKNSSDIIGNRTRNLPVCSSVPQPTAPPRTPKRVGIYHVLAGVRLLQRTYTNKGLATYATTPPD